MTTQKASRKFLTLAIMAAVQRLGSYHKLHR